MQQFIELSLSLLIAKVRLPKVCNSLLFSFFIKAKVYL